jgi:RNA polymerase sigma-70 factor (sigma-E family)
VAVDSQRSFEEYVRARTVPLSRVAYLLAGDHHLAEDLVQQTFLKLAGRWRAVVSSGDPDAYARRILYHEHISRWRRRTRRPVEVAALDAGPVAPDPGDAVAVTIMVRRALARLGARQRAVLVLRYFEDLSEAQTAAASWFACRARRPVSTWPGISWRPTGSVGRSRRCRPGSPTGSSRGPAGCCSSWPSSSRSSPTGG